jgi:DNA-binding HxlR family transcriptional regulator
MRWNELDQEACSVARAVAVIGDRWSLLILRDCFLRIRRFDDFQARLGITRHVLADRLKKLVDLGVLCRVRYAERPARYEYRLTEKGIDLYPVLLALVHWGDRYMVTPEGPPLLHRHKNCGALFEPVMVCSVCGEKLNAREVVPETGPGAASSVLPLLPRTTHHNHD